MNTFVNLIKAICNPFSGEPDLTGPASGPVQELMNSGFGRKEAELYVRGWRPGPDPRGLPSWEYRVRE